MGTVDGKRNKIVFNSKIEPYLAASFFETITLRIIYAVFNDYSIILSERLNFRNENFRNLHSLTPSCDHRFPSKLVLTL